MAYFVVPGRDGYTALEVGTGRVLANGRTDEEVRAQMAHQGIAAHRLPGDAPPIAQAAPSAPPGTPPMPPPQSLPTARVVPPSAAPPRPPVPSAGVTRAPLAPPEKRRRSMPLPVAVVIAVIVTFVFMAVSRSGGGSMQSPTVVVPALAASSPVATALLSPTSSSKAATSQLTSQSVQTTHKSFGELTFADWFALTLSDQKGYVGSAERCTSYSANGRVSYIVTAMNSTYGQAFQFGVPLGADTPYELYRGIVDGRMIMGAC